MAYIRIPTGQKTVTATSKSNRYLYYCCTACRKEALDLYFIAGSASGSYHVLQSSGKKEDVRSQASGSAFMAMREQDRQLNQSINENRDYKKVTRKVVCPWCGVVQPWSNYRSPVKALLPGLLCFLGAAGMVMRYTNTVSDVQPLILIVIALLTGLGVYLWSGYFKKRSAMKDFQTSQDEKPVYFNDENDSLLNSEEKYRTLLQMYYSCPQCGTRINPNSRSGRCAVCTNPVHLPSWEGQAIEARNHGRRTALICFWVAIAMLCGGIWFSAVNPHHEAIELSEISSSEVVKGQHYHGTFLVVDGYGTISSTSYGKSEVTTLYALGITAMKNDSVVFNMEFNKNTREFTRAMNYTNSSTQQVGDLIIDAYFTAGRMAKDKMAGFRDQALSTYRSMLTDMDTVSGIDLSMDYFCEDGQDNFDRAMNQGEHTIGIILYVACAILTLAGFIVLIRSSKRTGGNG